MHREDVQEAILDIELVEMVHPVLYLLRSCHLLALDKYLWLLWGWARLCTGQWLLKTAPRPWGQGRRPSGWTVPAERGGTRGLVVGVVGHHCQQ